MIRNLKIKNILVLCPSAWDLEELLQPRLSGSYRFLFHGAEYRKPRLTFNALKFLSRTLSTFKTERIDGVVEAATVGAFLRRRAKAQPSRVR